MSINKTLLKFEQRDILGTRPVDGACLIYGLACLGALRTHKDRLCPELAVVAVSDALSVLTDTDKNRLLDTNCTAEWDTTHITWASLSSAVRVTVEILLAAGTQALNAAYVDDGYNLMHILAADGQSKCLEIVLQMCGGDSLDLLARTKSGATALQLARQNKHTAAADLLEEVTQRAAEARQAALLEEIEAADKDDSARKAKKKKSVTRSASFAAQQPDEKSQKTDATATDHHQQQSQGDAELPSEEDGAASAAEQARVELRQRLEEEYELALEERRMELAKQQQQQHDQQHDHQSMQTNSGEDSSSAENPSTPRAMLEAGLTTGGNNGDSANGGTGSGSNSNSGAEDDFMMLIGGSLDAAIAAPAASLLGEGNAMLRRTPSSATLSPYTISPSVPLPNGAKSDLNNMAIHGLGMLGANSFDHGAAATGGGNGSSIQKEHSLFGSPSLTGSLFGTGSYGSGSPGFSTGLHAAAGGGASGYGTTQQQLPDALFIHHGLSTEEALNQNNNASFLSGLAGINHVVPQMNSAYGQRVPSIGGGSANTGGSGSSDGDSDASSEPTRHLWIGNLGTRTPRAVLKAVFETHGIVEDVVTFPGRMYAFVNFCTTEEAIQATNILQNQVVPELTGDRPLLLKYRPVKKAEMHLRSLVGDSMLDGSDLQHIGGLVSSAVGGGHGFGSSGGLSALGNFGSSSVAAGLRSPGLVGGLMMPGNGVNSSMLPADLDGNCSDPSPRIWLGNIAPTATSKTLQAVLGRFGPLTDAAVFPARIGPLGYAFVKFEALEDAIRALETLNNTVVPPLSGSKQLKMRYKPAASGPAGREESMNDSSKSQTMPSRHLWLGNITQKPTEDIIFQAFAKFGRVDSARVFPAKAYAFVNFSDINAAVRAMTEMEGVCIPCLTGVKPLVMRFQQENQQQPTGPPPVLNPMLRASNSLANVTGLASAFNNPHMSRVQSESALALAASLNQLVPGAGAPGLSDDHPHGLVGVVPNTNSSTPATWSPEQAAQMHRSASLNLLSRNGAAGTPAPSPFGPSMLGLSSSDHHHHHHSSSNNNGSASSSQLSAVLNNLAALQRAASIGGGAAAAPGTGRNAPAHQDIASLSTMLASQSLASEAAMRPSTATGNIHGWNSSTANGLDGLFCPLSKQLMTDPVLAADGVTYNKPAISEWLSSQTISPVLQTPLPHGGLVPNHAVKDAVLGYLRMQLRVAA
jgi:RNA recognition motif-containing protein